MARPCADGPSAAFPVGDALHLVLVDKPCIPFSRLCVSSPMNPLHPEIPLEEIPWGKPQHSGALTLGQEPTPTRLTGAKPAGQTPACAGHRV